MELNNNLNQVKTSSKLEPLQELRSRVERCKELVQLNVKLDDALLTKFLRARDFDADKAHEMLKGYFAMKSGHPEFFRLPSKVKHLVSAGLVNVMPQTNKTGHAILVQRPGAWDTSKWNLADVIAAAVTVLELNTLDENVQRKGFVEVMDMKGFGFGHMLRCNPFMAKLGADLTERSLPVKFRVIHVINGNRFLQMVYSMVKPFLSEDIRKKIIFHGSDHSKIYDDIPIDLLPTELGGNFKFANNFSSVSENLDAKLKAHWDKYAPMD